MIIERNAIARQLGSGAVGVGETHGQPHAVDAIIECIHQNAVRNLFVEGSSIYFQLVINEAKVVFAKTQGSMDERKAELKRIISHSVAGMIGESAADYTRLLVEAVPAGVDVWAAEDNKLYTNIRTGATFKGVSARNVAALAFVKEKLNAERWDEPNACKSVLLFGDDHFALRGNGFVSLEIAFGDMPYWPASAPRDGAATAATATTGTTTTGTTTTTDSM
ncbi:MAG TPA: hypothetical protein VGN52_00205 [Burkholderiales bacterium]|jgi:hypothetical protein